MTHGLADGTMRSMSISPEFIERYQLEYEKNPNSRIFAPLAEAYRQMGLLNEAYQICQKGVEKHPTFAGGRVQLAKIQLDRKDVNAALKELEKAVEISPDNLLAHTLLGQTLLDLRRPKEALKSFKMVLFLNPTDARALKFVRKWEFLSADEYADELFQMKPIYEATYEEAPRLEPLGDDQEILPQPSAAPDWLKRTLDRALSLADAFTVRGEPVRALETLLRAQSEIGSAGEIDRRIDLLSRRLNAHKVAGLGVDKAEVDSLQSTGRNAGRRRRKEQLETFLRRINERRSES